MTVLGICLLVLSPVLFAAGAARFEFDIPSQPLATALISYSEQSEIVFLYQTELVENLRCNAIRGRMTAAEALERLLDGTRLEYELTAPDTIVLRRKGSVSPTGRRPAPRAVERTRERSIEEEIEAVTVTARRRREWLHEYSGTASVFNAGALEAARVDGLEDIVNRVPNAYFEERPGSAINIFIRGAGTATNGSATQTDAAVGLYVDGIYSYLQGSRIPLVFYDMERIEIFKGPQGSLYGRNAVGGAVAAYTARPTQELESYVSLQRAEFDWSTAEARVNVPLGDSFALRLSGYYDDRDSYYTNVDPNRSEPGDRAAGGRLRLRYQPADSLDITLGYERLAEDTGPQILVAREFGERFISVSNTEDFVDRDTDRLIGLAEWSVRPEVLLRSITGYTQIDSLQVFDTNNLLIDPVRGAFVSEISGALRGYQLTQDLIVSSATEGPVEWLIGASYFKDRQRTATALRSGFGQALTSSANRDESATEMWAAFMDVSCKLGTKVVLDGSLRYSNERRNGRRSSSVVIDPNTGLPFPAGAFQFRNEYSRLSPGGSLSVFWTEDFMTYAKVSTAYQSGGINSRPQTIERSVFGPSTAINYEAGLKSTWLERRVAANLSVFRMIQDDYQYQVNNPPFNEFQNIGEARTDGVEVELVLRAADWLTIPLSYGYLDARLTRLSNPRGGTMQGQPLFGIPKNTATAGVDITLPLPRWGTSTEFYLRADYALTRNRYLGTNPVQLDDYELLDFKTGLRFAGRYEIYAFGENVTDDVHVITPAIASSRILSPPRSLGFGVSIALR